MPIIKSAIKRMRQTLTRRARNLKTKRSLRSAVKEFGSEKTTANLSKAQSELDKAVKKKIISKNTAARRKAQLAKKAKEAGATVTGTKKVAKPTIKPVKKEPLTTTKKAAPKKPAAKKTPAKKTEK